MQHLVPYVQQLARPLYNYSRTAWTPAGRQLQQYDAQGARAFNYPAYNYPVAPAVSTGRGFRGTWSRGAGEKKVIDTNVLNKPCDTTGTVTLVNSCDVGAQYTHRIGRKIYMDSVSIRGTIKPIDAVGNGANSTSTYCRVMLIWDKQPNGALASVNDILSVANSISFQNLDNRDRFKVLMNKNFITGPLFVDTTATQTWAIDTTPSRYIDYYKSLRKKKWRLHTIFDGTGGGVADISTGALLVVTIGDSAANIGGEADMRVRVRFTEI